jgi:chlorite dismutase
MPPPLFVAFAAVASGTWRIDRMEAVLGDGLPTAERLAVIEGKAAAVPTAASWVLRGATSNTRYTNRSELEALVARQEGLARPQATRAALIPIRKTEAWWALAQDERRALFEERSRHIAIGLEYLPAVARRLHHSRELGEPFDFLTWFEYAPEHADAFDELVRRLRETEEWRYVDREIDIRLSRDRT